MKRETKADKLEREKYTEDLRKLLPKGGKIYSIVRSVSRSGMKRAIDLFYFDDTGGKHWLSYRVAKVLGWRLNKEREIVVSGCGMDMCFHTVYTLASVLFRGAEGIEPGREGYALKSEVL